jgi:hypothetical protein
LAQENISQNIPDNQNIEDRISQLEALYSVMNKTRSETYKATLREEIAEHKEFFESNDSAKQILDKSSPDTATKLFQEEPQKQDIQYQKELGFEI